MQKQSTDFIYAGVWPRAAAYLVDKFIVVLMYIFIRLPAFIVQTMNGSTLPDVIFGFNAVDIFCYIVCVLYFVLLTWKSGRTPGKYLMRIIVVTDEGTQLCFFRALYRETIGRYLTGIFFIGYFAAGCDIEKRGFHDRLCDTRVIYALGRYAAYSNLPHDPQVAEKKTAVPSTASPSVISDNNLPALGFGGAEKSDVPCAQDDFRTDGYPENSEDEAPKD